MEKTTVWVPMYLNGSGHTAIPYSEICLAGDQVRRVSADGTIAEVGKAPASKGYTVLVYARNPGDEILIDRQQVTIPECKQRRMG